MKNKRLEILLAVFVLSGLFFTSYAEAAPATKPASGQEIVWKLHHWREAAQAEIPYMQLACDEIYKRSSGRLKIEIYPGFALGYKASTWLRDIKAGVIDITAAYNAFTAGEEPSFTVLETPQIWRTREQALLAANAFFGFKKKVYKEVWGGELLGQGTILEGGPELIFTKGKVIRSVSHLKGLKGPRGPVQRFIYEAGGCTPSPAAGGGLYGYENQGHRRSSYRFGDCVSAEAVRSR